MVLMAFCSYLSASIYKIQFAHTFTYRIGLFDFVSVVYTLCNDNFKENLPMYIPYIAFVFCMNAMSAHDECTAVEKYKTKKYTTN